jgi:hypothetical protein
MSTYGKSYTNGSAGGIGDQAQVPQTVVDEFPALASVLGGVYSIDGLVCEVPPASVILFAELGKVKFCIHPRRGDKVAFGTLSRPEAGFSALNDEIEAGNFEWKRGKR